MKRRSFSDNPEVFGDVAVGVTVAVGVGVTAAVDRGGGGVLGLLAVVRRVRGPLVFGANFGSLAVVFLVCAAVSACTGECRTMSTVGFGCESDGVDAVDVGVGVEVVAGVAGCEGGADGVGTAGVG